MRERDRPPSERQRDDDYDRLLSRMSTDIYRLTVRKEEGDEGTAGVREPRRPKPLVPAAAIALDV